MKLNHLFFPFCLCIFLSAGTCFPEKKDAPLVAAYLARFGINAVRLHFLDSKPYIVSETNHPFPCEYTCEGIPISGAYASLQDWDCNLPHW